MTTRRIASCAHFDRNDAGLVLSKGSLTEPNSSTNDRSSFFSQSGKDVRCAWSVMKERVFSGGWGDGSRHQVQRGEGCQGLFQSRSGQRLVWRLRLWRTEDFGSPRTRADSQRIDEYPMGGARVGRESQFGIIMFVDLLCGSSDGQVHVAGLFGTEKLFNCSQKRSGCSHEIEADDHKHSADEPGWPGWRIEYPD